MSAARSTHLRFVAAALVASVAAASSHAAPRCGAAEPSRLAAPDASSPSPAGDPRAIKIVVRRDGPVLVTGSQLGAAGWDLDHVVPARVGLHVGGRPVAVEISGLEGSGLGPTSRLVFHGHAMAGRFTRDNVYWLVDSGSGLRPTSRTIAPGASEVATRWYTATLRRELDTEYYPSISTAQSEDRWLWGRPLAPGTMRTEEFRITAPEASGHQGTLGVRLRGCSSDDAIRPDHHVLLVLNDRPLADLRFDGVGPQMVERPVPGDFLRAGTNRLTVANVGDTGAAVDQVALDWFELVYRSELVAVDDGVVFAPDPLGRAFAVAGFTTPDIALYDVSDELRPVRLEGGQVRRASRGDYELLFGLEPDPTARYAAYAGGALRPPAQVVANTPSDWRTDRHGADWLVVTHGQFVRALEPLVAERAAQGLRTATVLVDDVYDEFSHGVFDPRAVRALLQYAYNRWERPAVSYVLLVGECSLDYLQAYGSQTSNFVPTMQVTSNWSGDLRVVTSDLWFANLEGADDSPPEVYIGRFPVSSSAEAATIVAKTLAYEAAIGAQWRDGAMLIVDDGPPAGLQQLAARMLAVMAPASSLRQFDAGRYPRERDLGADITRAIEEGVGIVAFVGHGNVDLWGPWAGGGPIYRDRDIAGLTNVGRPPILVSGACMNGWIDHPLKPTAMTELWLKHAGGGGVAAWSPSGLAAVEDLSGLLEDFVRALLEPSGADAGSRRGEASLGACADRAVRAAVARGPGPAGTARMFVLLGDPALVVAGRRGDATPSPAATLPSSVGGDARGRWSAWLPAALSSRP